MARKPKILKTKIKVAQLFTKLARRRGLHKSTDFNSPFRRNNSGYWWELDIEFQGVEYQIYYQLYVRKMGVDFVHIRRKEGFKHVTPKEVHQLHENLRCELNDENL